MSGREPALSQSIDVARVETFCLRADVANLPVSSLGAMRARNGLLVRVEDSDGAFGWGEVWCNFPPHAGQSRERLLRDVIVPEILGTTFAAPGDLYPALHARWHVMATHVGEPGPFTSAIAGLDMAVWDLWARRQDKPLHAALADEPAAPNPVNSVKVYASSPKPTEITGLIADLVAAGHTAVKLKVGYDPATDAQLVGTVRDATGPSMTIMIDANQSWDVDTAADCINRLAPYGLTFIEEPISALAPQSAWNDLAARVDVPLAAGENICDMALYDRHLAAGALRFYQPDVAKWGGIGGCAAVSRRIVDSGCTYCPHFMGTGIGLAASLHLLAAAGGGGFVELDANPNPLRTDLCDLDLTVRDGRVTVPAGPGIGVVPKPESLQRYQIV